MTGGRMVIVRRVTRPGWRAGRRALPKRIPRIVGQQQDSPVPATHTSRRPAAAVAGDPAGRRRWWGSRPRDRVMDFFFPSASPAARLLTLLEISSTPRAGEGRVLIAGLPAQAAQHVLRAER